MIKFSLQILQNVEEEIRSVYEDKSEGLQDYEYIIKTILKSLHELKTHLIKTGFKSKEEEIQFFKEIKPKIVSRLIYFTTIYNIKAKWPHGGEKKNRKYLNNELSKLKRFFNQNLEFYKYYRTNSTYLDHKFFIRGCLDIKLSLDPHYFQTDLSFSTSHDYNVAKIIANDLIQVYIEDQLYNNDQKKISDNSTLNWTGSKTAMIELIYALHSQGVLDNGNTDIKVIAKTFERVFNIELGDFYHTFMEIKSRKINRTKFLDSLCNALIRKMDEKEEL